MMPWMSIWLHKLRRLFRRSEWAVRLLQLECSPVTATAPGLLLVQIDGLSRARLEAALRAGQMPFLKRLQQREAFALHSFYSGLPSSTPAVQGELFYGVRTAVPAFEYRPTGSHRTVSMLETEAVCRVEDRLAASGNPPLLKGGSVYGDVFHGGATHRFFSTASFGLSSLLRQAHPGALLSVLAIHGLLLVRMVVLLLVEAVLAPIDLVRGVVERRSFWSELRFLPKRIAIVILLRELTQIGARIDAARGVPLIHCNFLGYDEQAHHRGPESRFAAWTLKGIDKAIKHIWHDAHCSGCRHYELWLYSDHGQEATIPYSVRHGQTIQDAVWQVLQAQGLAAMAAPGAANQAGPAGRAALLGGRWLQQWMDLGGGETRRAHGATAARGPLGHVYFKQPLQESKMNVLARALVHKAGIPAVLAADDCDGATAWTADGIYKLPEEAGALVGEAHPFLATVADDLVDLVRHPESGGLVLLGYCQGVPALSFPDEHGAHGGPGPEETHGFLLAPGDVGFGRHGLPIRPLDLRRAALACLGRTPATPKRRPVRPARQLRIMTYNIHSCIGLDGKLMPERVARIIEHYHPDVVALQEVDAGRARTARINQARHLAALLKMDYHFHPSFAIGGEQYGNTVLSRHPMQLCRAGRLPGADKREPRSVLWMEIAAPEVSVQFLCTHLSLQPQERRAQIESLLTPDWIGQAKAPLVCCGDFNMLRGTREYKRMATRLRDVTENSQQPTRTWKGLCQLDHMFITPGCSVDDLFVPSTYLTRIASDHLPLIADVSF